MRRISEYLINEDKDALVWQTEMNCRSVFLCLHDERVQRIKPTLKIRQ